MTIGVGVPGRTSVASIDYPAEIERIKADLYPSFEVPLRAVRPWVRGDDAAAKAAIEVLRHLRGRYPFAIQVGDELVLGLLQVGDVEAARAELRLLEHEFKGQFDEETLCRFGRLHRDFGDTFLSPPPGDYRRARAAYDAAWDWYYRAYGIRRGHYPGINVAALYLLRAWVGDPAQRAALVASAVQTAKDLLADRKNWPADLPDDAVWHTATEGDAALLLGDLDATCRRYREALALADQPFYKRSIGKQVHRLRTALAECLDLPADGLDAVEEVFR